MEDTLDGVLAIAKAGEAIRKFLSEAPGGREDRVTMPSHG